MTVTTVAAALALAAMPLSPAAAATPADLAIGGVAHLDGGFGAVNSTGTFGGLAVGVHGTSPVVAADAFATFTYSNPNTITGDAHGDLVVPSEGIDVHFEWERLGISAVVVFWDPDTSSDGHPHDVPDELAGVGAAAFGPVDVGSELVFPVPPDHTGHGPATVHAALAGAGVLFGDHH